MPDPFIFPDYLGNEKVSKNKKYNQGKEWEEPRGDKGSFRPQTVFPLFDYRKLKWIYAFILIVFVILAFRLFYLQVVLGSSLKEAAEENRYRIQVLRAPRGIIYDRDKKMLVKNIPSYDLVAVPADLPRQAAKRKEEFNQLSKIADLSDKETQKAIKNLDLKSYQTVIIKSNLEREKALEILVNESSFPGIKVEANPQREYIFSTDFFHVLGYIGKLTKEDLKEEKGKNEEYILTDWLGREGIEASYEKSIKGENGKEQVEVDSFGNVIKQVARRPSFPGQSIYTTLNLGLQKKVKETLAAGAKSHPAAAVAVNPKNGEVLAMVSLPSFDSNLFIKGFSEDQAKEVLENENRPLVNRAIAGVYPPGSTVKPFIAAAALEDGVIDKNTTIEDKGVIEVPHKYNPDIIYRFYGWDKKGLGPMNIFSAISRSSDIYFYYVGGGYSAKDGKNFQGLGDERLQHYYKIFGFGQRTDIDLPGEVAGLIPNAKWKQETKKEEWYLGDTYNISIGQGDILVTPLQMAMCTAAIANGGTLYKPYLLLKTTDSQGNILQETKSEIVREKFIRQANLDLVKEGMRQAVTDGSAKSLADLPIDVAGKTGTAEHGGSQTPHAWFTAFAPYSDPEIAVVVLVEEGGEGSETAAPIAKEIIKWWAENKSNNK